jgi:class 3 adenylate cyclase/tetratricopeptide (TPR) repeat protein
MSCGTALGHGAQLTGVDERKVVSVLFCDLVGFTASADNADPEDVKAMLRSFHSRVLQELQRFGGTVEKFIGDAVMAVFGAPVAHEDDAERAVRSALAIVDAIEELNEADPRLRLAIRIGVNTGEALVSLGAEPHREGLVAGDVVNTASRLQEAAPAGGAVVSESTYRVTRDLFEYEPLSSVTVKGKGQAVPIWRAIGVRGQPGYGVARRAHGMLVGREDELELLRRIFARARREPSVQLVTIMGEPGVGKSRLLAEFFAFVKALPDPVYWRQGRCLPYGQGITFWALGEVVKAQAGMLASDAQAEASSKLDAAVRACVQDASEQEWLKQRLTPLVGLAPAEAVGAPERAEHFAAWRRFLEAIAAIRPLVVVVEDLHWADRALVEFLDHLLDWSSEVPMLVLCTARPELDERHPGWGGGKRNSTTMTLPPLSDEDMSRLIDALSSAGPLPQRVREVVRERAEGNPLYAEEFVAMLGEREGTAERITEETPAAGTVPLPSPESIQAIIAARLDTLSPERKLLLQDASVVGKVFWSGALSFISGVDEPLVAEALHELVRKELVRRARASSVKDQVEYSFWHILIRDVAYSQIPRAARARRHSAVAEWVRGVAGERVADVAEIVAHHYRQALELARAAGEVEQARELEEPTCRFLVMAGDRAIGLDVGQAREHYRAALQLLPPSHPGRGKVLARSGETAARAGRFSEAEEEYSEAISELRSLGELLPAGDTMVKSSNMLWRRGEISRSRRVLGEGIALLEREPPSVELANAYTEMAGHMVVQGRLGEAIELSDRSLALARSLGVDEQVPRPLGFRGAARCNMGDLAGLDDLREALDLAQKLGLGREAARMRGLLAEVIWLTEGPARSLEISRTGIELAERMGSMDLAMAFRAETLRPLFDLGDWDELLQGAEQVVQWAGADGERYFALLAQSQCARVLVCRGEVTAAAALADRFLPVAREIADSQVLVTALAAAALVELARNGPTAAVALIEELEEVTRDRSGSYRAQHVCDAARVCVAGRVMDLAERLLQGVEVSVRRHALSVLTARAILGEARSDVELASKAFQEAADGWRDFGFLLEEGEARLGGGRILVRLGRPEASDVLREARAIFTRLNAVPRVAETSQWLDRAAVATP